MITMKSYTITLLILIFCFYNSEANAKTETGLSKADLETTIAFSPPFWSTNLYRSNCALSDSSDKMHQGTLENDDDSVLCSSLIPMPDVEISIVEKHLPVAITPTYNRYNQPIATPPPNLKSNYEYASEILAELESTFSERHFIVGIYDHSGATPNDAAVYNKELLMSFTGIHHGHGYLVWSALKTENFDNITACEFVPETCNNNQTFSATKALGMVKHHCWQWTSLDIGAVISHKLKPRIYASKGLPKKVFKTFTGKCEKEGTTITTPTPYYTLIYIYGSEKLMFGQ